MDIGTMIESFKFLKYYQLAKSSLVSKRYWNLIRTHRHKLALLDVNRINMSSSDEGPAVIKMFNEELSPEEYNKFIARNRYSKQIPLDGQITGKESTEIDRKIYVFGANVYQNQNNCPDCATSVFYARAELKDETWPIFQHFMRLLTDPFISIRSLILNPQKDVFPLLTGAMNPDHNRLQCEQLMIRLHGDTRKFVVWIKDHVRCDKFDILLDRDSNYDEELLDLFLTGAPCTSAINIIQYDLSKVIVDLVQKFMGLKNEYQLVESIRGAVEDEGVVEALKRNCAELIAEEEKYDEDRDVEQGVGFINNDIKKKLTLNRSLAFDIFSIKITNL